MRFPLVKLEYNISADPMAKNMNAKIVPRVAIIIPSRTTKLNNIRIMARNRLT